MKSLRLSFIYVVIAFLFLTSSVFSQSFSSQLSLEDIFYKRTYYTKGVEGINPLNDGKSFSEIVSYSTGSIKIVRTSYESGKVLETFVDFNELPLVNGKVFTPSDYSFNPDESKILFSVLKERLYRHSTINYYYIYDIKTKSLNEIPGYGMYADFSPDGKNLAIVRDNNIFITALDTYSEKQITTDGKFESIINGMTDWVYEEEFRLNRGFYWSPDGDKIAYYKFDETNVKEFSLTYYEELYPKEYKYKYPKAGQENSKVYIYVYDLKSEATKQINTTDENDFYIPRIKWTNDNNTLSFQILNRHQNKLDLYFADANTGSSRLIFSHSDKNYFEMNHDLTFVGKDKFIWNENSNLYLYDINGSLLNNISAGKEDVDKFYGYDKNDNRVYYSSFVESPMTRSIYSVNLDGTGIQKISQKTGWNKAAFSTDFSFYINTYSTIATPDYITINNSAGKEISVLETNEELRQKITELNFPKPEFFTFKLSSPVAETNIDYLNGFIIKPKNFDASKKYPVMFYTYGGPGSQTVTDEWLDDKYFWFG